jgi:hypothetical protein
VSKHYPSQYSIEPILDSVVNRSYQHRPVKVLYHYTDWGGARGIISNQHIWETAHDCVNDDHELESAHEVILEVAHKLLRKSGGAATRSLYHFIQAYERLKISKMKTVYMACFSSARDDEYQWKNYAADGRGLCLGIRVLNEAVPISDIMASALLEVDYSQESWKKYIQTSFKKICASLSRYKPTSQNIQEGTSALFRIAAFTAIRAKKAKWAPEQEFRHVTIIRDGVDFEPQKRTRGGKEVRFLNSITLRESGKLLAFAEIIIGPNQDTAKATDELTELLKAAGYIPNTLEYPTLAVSELASW